MFQGHLNSTNNEVLIGKTKATPFVWYSYFKNNLVKYLQLNILSCCISFTGSEVNETKTDSSSHQYHRDQKLKQIDFYLIFNFIPPVYMLTIEMFKHGFDI